MYSLGAYGSMIAHRARTDAYAEALRKTVRKGSIVLEIGTGPGAFAVLACQLGAGRVFAIEGAEIIQVAREVAAANGCSGKIEFFEDFSERVTLPARADVIVSDLRGALPLFKGHIPAIADARRRFLAREGSLIPRKDTMWAAIVQAPKAYGDVVDCWEHNSLGLDLSAARGLAVNNLQHLQVSPSQLLTEHRLWTSLDYASVECADVQGNLDWTVERAGTGHGILMWFDADLAEGIGFSNAPGSPEGIYDCVFFPWTEPVPLMPGQFLSVDLDARLVQKDYVWRWNTHIEAIPGSGTSAIHFDQSQLSGVVLSPNQLHRLATDYIPQLSEEGILRRRTLELINGRLSVEGIAHRLASEFPQRFPSVREALSYAGIVSQEYSR